MRRNRKIEAYDYGPYSACWSCYRKNGETVRATHTLSWPRIGRYRVQQNRAACEEHARAFDKRFEIGFFPEEEGSHGEV